jgi:hypothetical protein
MKNLLPLLLCLGACDDHDFVAASRLDRLRVLALRSEPVVPRAGESTLLTPLVHAPGGAPVTYAWSWCPVKGDAADGYRCPVDDAELAELAASLELPEAPPPLRLGGEPTQVLANVFPAATLAALCREGFRGAKPDCDEGFPIRVLLTVESGDARVTATTVLQLPIRDDWEVNLNPEVGALSAQVDGQPVVLGEEPTLLMARLVDHALHVDVDPATAESFVDAEGEPVRERLSIGWFAETGELEEDRTAYIDGLTPFAAMLDNTFRVSTSEQDPGGPTRFYVVLRDQRGGVAWTTARVTVEETP